MIQSPKSFVFCAFQWNVKILQMGWLSGQVQVPNFIFPEGEKDPAHAIIHFALKVKQAPMYKIRGPDIVTCESNPYHRLFILERNLFYGMGVVYGCVKWWSFGYSLLSHFCLFTFYHLIWKCLDAGMALSNLKRWVSTGCVLCSQESSSAFHHQAVWTDPPSNFQVKPRPLYHNKHKGSCTRRKSVEMYRSFKVNCNHVPLLHTHTAKRDTFLPQFPKSLILLCWLTVFAFFPPPGKNFVRQNS